MGWWRRWRAGRFSGEVVARLGDFSHRLGTGPRAEFRARLRDELLKTHENERVTAEQPPHDRPAISTVSRWVLIRPWAGLGAMIVATLSTAMVTYTTVPGDLLYPLKRAAESTLLTFTTDDADLADRQMTAAKARAGEAAALLQAATPDRQELLKETLQDMDSTTRAALNRVKPRTRVDAKEQAKVRKFAREQRNRIEPMLPKMDQENRERANEYLVFIDGYTVSGY
ncbi:hypothetical protein Aph01nite_07550 [Acrocarpospora phusangensis]|uniref:DUF5667 domain-containing protein n=1 Tax=Acrocarpospora phusangensis TaxID=1070424 RepID=A0A919UN78_9ACTN|nr:DUF5667 domain-containing protein [Acrocarpospora phusangensis]GIH22445.1 hypothetical protein Aph01nite_07550 [Acrocarpospora phusangensis]